MCVGRGVGTGGIERIVLGYVVSILLEHVIAWTKTAIVETRLLLYGAQVSVSKAALLVGVGHNFVVST